MTITRANEAPTGIEFVRQGLDRFSVPTDARLNESSASTARSAVEAADGPRIDHYHPVYDLGAEIALNGRGLDAAELVGFRYIVHAADGELSAAEIRTDATPGAPPMTMTKRIYGSYAEAVVGRLEQVEKLPEVAARTYELRVLECPGISLALWLKGDQGAPDILWPLSPAAGEFHPDRPYSADEFLDIVRRMIQARVADQAALLEREKTTR